MLNHSLITTSNIGQKHTRKIAKIIEGILSKTASIEVRQTFWVEPINM